LAKEQREWVDIDQSWLRDYLEKNDLAIGYDLEDDLIGSQVSWILSPDEWIELCSAWEEQRPESVADDANAPAEPEDRQEDPEQRVETAHPQLSELEGRTPETGSPPTETALESACNELERINGLIQRALSDWAAFRELFGSGPDSAGIDTWETLAQSPATLLNQAEEMIAVQRVAAEVQEHQSMQEREAEISQVQNILFGYYIYCRKRSSTPSLEHALAFIPDLATEYAVDVVREAWRREAENR